MIKEVKLPEVSDNVETGDVIKVLVKVGDEIKIDQPVIELETDKASFEVPSSENGIVKEVNVKQGDIIKIGAVILKVETNGQEGKAVPEAVQIDKKYQSEAETERKSNSKEKEFDSRAAEKVQESILVRSEDPVEYNVSGKNAAPASPSVRRMSRELGVNINSVKGSGRDRRITEDDIKNFVKLRMTAQTGSGVSVPPKSLPDFSKWGATEIVPLSRVRSITAESMTYAWTTIPMVTQFDKSDITQLEDFRKKNLKKVEASGGRLTITSILVKVSEAALRAFPKFNSSIDLKKNEIIYKKYFNIGVAVDTDRGLLVPVIKDVDTKSITEISKELGELAEKARSKKISLEEMDGGNFTISNLGGIGGTNFTPIVYSPQVAILGVSRGSIEAVYVNGNFEPGMILPLSLTYDHRIIDGADAARFLRWICEALENPLSMLL